MNLSIDIGGSKTRVVLVEGISESGEMVVLREMVYVSADFFINEGGIIDGGKAGDVAVRVLGKLFERVIGDFPEAAKGGQGVGVLGLVINCVVSGGKLVYNRQMGGLMGGGLALGGVVAGYFKFERFLVDNDVMGMVKAELKFGVGVSCQNFLLVNLGTGIRLANVAEGRILKGAGNLAGEIAEMPIYVKELEDFTDADLAVAGRGLSLLDQVVNSRDDGRSAKEIIDIQDWAVLDKFIPELVRFLRNACEFYNPEKIVLVGGLVNSDLAWVEKLKVQFWTGTEDLTLAKEIVISQVQFPASLGALLE